MVLGHVNGPAVSEALIARVSQAGRAPVEAWVALLACRGEAADRFLAAAQQQPHTLGQVNNARMYWAQSFRNNPLRGGEAMYSFKFRCPPLMFAAVVLAGAAAATAQQAPRGVDDMVLVTHEVGDLVMQIPDYSAISEQAAVAAVPPGGMGGGFGGGGGGFGGGGMGRGGEGDVGRFGGADARTDSNLGSITFDTLIDAVTATINPASWTENGGGAGEIQPVGTTLVVLQTPEAQNQISQLLDALRGGSARDGAWPSTPGGCFWTRIISSASSSRTTRARRRSIEKSWRFG